MGQPREARSCGRGRRKGTLRLPQALESLWLGEGSPRTPATSCLSPHPPLPGCRCPSGQLVQDGRCVPVSSCRCGLPSPNASWELAPAEVVQLDCRNWYDCPPMTTRGRGALGGRLGLAQGYRALLGSKGCSP